MRYVICSNNTGDLLIVTSFVHELSLVPRKELYMLSDKEFERFLALQPLTSALLFGHLSKTCFYM